MEDNIRPNNKGFTLVEMIVTIVILGILLAILIPGMFRYIEKAKDKQLLVNATSTYKALQAELLLEYSKPDANLEIIVMTYERKMGWTNDDISDIPVGAKAIMVLSGNKDVDTVFEEQGFGNFINPKTGEIEAMLYIENGKYVTYPKYTGWGEAKDFNGVIIE